MPPRFWSSPFKNAVATPAKREGWYSELPLATSLANETSDGIQATADYWLALGSASGSLLAVPHATAPGKFASKAPSFATGLRTITSFAADDFSDHLYVGGEGGAVNVFDLPPVESFTASESPSSLAPSPLFSLSTGSNKTVDFISTHPLASGLALAGSATNISVIDASAGAVVKAFEVPSPTWSGQWSMDGRLITTTSKDGKLRVWDVRQGGSAVGETTAHAGLKPTRHVHLSPSSSGAAQLCTTGTTRTRDREYSLFDLRNLGGAIKTQRLDTNTGVLQPVLDESRGIVYLAGRGDMTLRWVEVGGPSVFTEGAAPLPAPLLSATLLPPAAQQTYLDLQHAEINRLLVLAPSAQSVFPVEVKVPRRQYIDFFPELFPPVAAGVPALSAADWIAGKDDEASLERRHLEPGRTWPKKDKAVSTAPCPAPTVAAAPAPPSEPRQLEQAQEELALPVPVVEEKAASPPVPAAAAPSPAAAQPEPPTAQLSNLPVNKPQQRPIFGGSKTASPTPATPSPAPTPTSALAPAPVPAQPVKTPPPPPPSAPSPSPPAPAPKAASSPAASKPASSHSKGPFNTGWSRKYLTGKTPLKPDYFDVKDLSATTGNDVQLLKATPLYLFYPLSGPGGRLAVHPVTRKRRLPFPPRGLQNGATIVEFATSPFNPRKVFIAGDDGVVKVFELPSEEELTKEGWEEKVNGAQGKALSAPRVDKISALAHHPAAKDLLLVVSDDHGSPTARVWDIEKAQIIVSSVAWSPDGALLAVATKNKQIHILDPRNPSSVTSSPSHDSVRPVRLVWTSDSHLATTGFNRAASRELKLFKLDTGAKKLSEVGKISLDVSPGLLFPYFDLDTRILFLYARGERSCLTFEVDLADGSKKPFDKLSSSFEHGTLQNGFAFLPKTKVDVRAVEVARAFRLSPQEIQVVSFQVPRAKADRFQDDVFVQTLNTEKPTMTAEDYAAGRDKPLERVDLRPEGMALLSEAPAQHKVVSTRDKIKANELTDEQRASQHMDAVFTKAQDEGEDEEDHPVRSQHAVVDDDDW
ncbi:hypothetical protein JCM8547_004132 [Rhodosporidiobolus lusitaniae]